MNLALKLILALAATAAPTVLSQEEHLGACYPEGDNGRPVETILTEEEDDFFIIPEGLKHVASTNGEVLPDVVLRYQCRTYRPLSYHNNRHATQLVAYDDVTGEIVERWHISGPRYVHNFRVRHQIRQVVLEGQDGTRKSDFQMSYDQLQIGNRNCQSPVNGEIPFVEEVSDQDDMVVRSLPDSGQFYQRGPNVLRWKCHTILTLQNYNNVFSTRLSAVNDLTGEVVAEMDYHGTRYADSITVFENAETVVYIGQKKYPYLDDLTISFGELEHLIGVASGP